MVASAIIGVAGLSLITVSEGTRNKAYLDPVGIPTICTGHTGPEVRMGQTWSDEKCRQTLLQDVRVAQRYLVRSSPTSCLAGSPLTPNQRDALTSFVFNVGGANFCKSTMAVRLRNRDYIGASLQFSRWKYARTRKGPVVLPGLVTRREAERRLFLTVSRPEPSTALSGTATAILKEATKQ